MGSSIFPSTLVTRSVLKFRWMKGEGKKIFSIPFFLALCLRSLSFFIIFSLSSSIFGLSFFILFFNSLFYLVSCLPSFLPYPLCLSIYLSPCSAFYFFLSLCPPLPISLSISLFLSLYHPLLPISFFPPLCQSLFPSFCLPNPLLPCLSLFPYTYILLYLCVYQSILYQCLPFPPLLPIFTSIPRHRFLIPVESGNLVCCLYVGMSPVRWCRVTITEGLALWKGMGHFSRPCEPNNQ